VTLRAAGAGCRNVTLSLPVGAARLEVLLPATVAGRRVWRLAWSREVEATR
jgi:hypothetical protein